MEWSIGPQKSPRVLAPTRVNPLFSGRAYASATLVSRNASSNLGRGKIGKFFSSEFFLVSIVREKGGVLSTWCGLGKPEWEPVPNGGHV